MQSEGLIYSCKSTVDKIRGKCASKRLPNFKSWFRYQNISSEEGKYFIFRTNKQSIGIYFPTMFILEDIHSVIIICIMFFLVCGTSITFHLPWNFPKWKEFREFEYTNSILPRVHSFLLVMDLVISKGEHWIYIKSINFTNL